MGINRNILECKGWMIPHPHRRLLSINRNILECKALEKYRSGWCNLRINRNILECKVAWSFTLTGTSFPY